MKPPLDSQRTILIYGLLVLITLIAFEPMRHNGFVVLDDNVYLTSQPRVKGGLSGEGIAWAFTTGAAGNWHPLTWLSHMLDVELFGMNPVGHHAVSLLLHLLSALLLFRFLGGATGAIWPSAFVAAVFAVHPQRVESVAWAAERKDVLSALFWMLTLLAYSAYTRKPSVRRYLPVMAAMVAGLMAKPMLVTLPFVLLLLDYWPLARLGRNESETAGAARKKKKPPRSDPPVLPARRLIVEKIPLFALVAISCTVTFLFQQRIGAVQVVSFDRRVANALLSYLGYIAKTVWPVDLAVMYPFPQVPPPLWRVFLAGLVLAGVTAGAILLGRRRRYLAVGWLWYVGTLVPVIGLVQVGYQASADRYTYLPSIGLAVMVAWGVAEVAARFRLRAAWTAVPAAILLAALVVGTRAQLRYWRDSISLYEHAIEVTEGNFLMYANLGVEFGKRGDVDSAMRLLRKSVSIRPDFDHAHYNLGVFLQDQGRLEEAMDEYRRVLEIVPDYVNAHYNLGALLASQNRLDEAIPHFRRAAEAEPEFFQAGYALATALRAAGDLDGAIVEFARLLRDHPSAGLHYDLGRTLHARGNVDEAIRHYRSALELAPQHAEAHYYLARALASRGKTQEAAQHLQRARQLGFP